MTMKKETTVQAEETVKKAPVKKAAPKKAAVKKETSQNVYIQFEGKEVLTAEILEQVKETWKAEGHRVSSIKTLDIYVKPEEHAAYYVINGKTTGKVEL